MKCEVKINTAGARIRTSLLGLKIIDVNYVWSSNLNKLLFLTSVYSLSEFNEVFF